MRPDVERLFHELADLSPQERESCFREKNVPADVRAEVESLLRFDMESGRSLTECVAGAAKLTLQTGAEAKEGSRCGPYRLVRALGSGGMGSVYLAERADGEIEQRVAIKLLRYGADEPAFRARFRRERQILAGLSHPGIAGLLNAGHTADGQPYLAMDYIDGTSIDVYAKTLDLRDKVRLFLRVCDAVSYAHRNLVVHRDIKPSNILVDAAGEPKLLDFGIAKLLEDEEGSQAATLLTREGGAALTPLYAAPEQVTGGPVTTATDVYALGVLLYVLLTGQHPAGPGPHSSADVIKALVDTEPPRPSAVVGQAGAAPATTAARRAGTPEKLCRELRGDLDTIVAKALKKNPQERYSSVAALADDLHRYLRHEPISARPDTFAYRGVKFARRNRVAVALATAALVATVAGVVGTLIQARTARAQRDFAFVQLSRAEAINDLNNFLLTDAAPSGKPFTVNELLGRAEHILQRQQGGDDMNRVSLLVSIGRQYWSQDEDARARDVLEQAYKLSRGLAERSTRAEASCALASALARSGEHERAEALIREGLRELPNDPQFALARVSCLLHGGEVARERGAAQEGIARTQAARHVLRESPFQSDLLDSRALMELAESYRVAGQHVQANAAFEEASARLASLGRDDTQAAGTLFNNWGVSLSAMGRPLEAEKVLKRAIDISRADATEETVSPMLLINYARVLRDLGRLDEAADYAGRGLAKATQAGDQVAVNQAISVQAIVYRARGDLARATAALADLETRLRKDLPPGHIAFASLTSEKALLAQGANDLPRALELSNQAVAAAEASIKAGGQGVDFLPSFLLRRSAIELQLHRSDEAAADAARALGAVQKTAQPGTFSTNLGRAYLALGRALLAQGNREDARAALRPAVEHLQSALGPDHPDTRAARQLQDLGIDKR